MKEEMTLAYLAGLLDADGYFTIVSDIYRCRHGKRPYPDWYEKVGLKQISPTGPDLLAQVFGGYRGLQASNTANGKSLHCWAVTNKKAADCVHQLLPYLRIKKEQAEILTKLRANKRSGGGKALTPDDVSLRQLLLEEIRGLNDTRNPLGQAIYWDKPRQPTQKTP